jgi:polyferredoxin
MWSPLGGRSGVPTQGHPKETGLINTAGTKFTCCWLNPLNFLAITFENINNLALYLRHASKKRKSKKKNRAKI